MWVYFCVLPKPKLNTATTKTHRRETMDRHVKNHEARRVAARSGTTHLPIAAKTRHPSFNIKLPICWSTEIL